MTSARALRFVCSLARSRPAAADQEQAAACAPEPWEWPALADELWAHGVAPLVWHNLGEGLRARVPEPQRREMERLQLASTAWALRAQAACDRVLDRLSAAGIAAIALKGIALARRLYPSPGLRPMVDVDLYVPAAHMARAIRCLEAVGPYDPGGTRLDRAHFEESFHVQGVKIDLHRAFVQPGRYPLDYPGIEARAVTIQVDGRPLTVLDPVDTVIHLCVHMGVHYFETGLKWLVDLHEIAVQWRPDWQTIVDRARDSGAATIAYLALSAARHLLHTPVPAPVLAALRPGKARSRWLGALLDRRAPVMADWSGPRWLRRGLLFFPICDRPLRVLPFALRHEWLRLLDAVRPQDARLQRSPRVD